ncbi:MAG: hypothetical protein ACRCZF_27050, partial [Gemmataceae bacterium]
MPMFPRGNPRFPPRYPSQFTQADLRRIARLPSCHGPRAVDVFTDPGRPRPAQWTAEQLALWGGTAIIGTGTRVTAASVTGRFFLSFPEVFRQLPEWRHVRLVAIQPFITELAACPHLAQFEELNLQANAIPPAELQLLLDSPYFKA